MLKTTPNHISLTMGLTTDDTMEISRAIHNNPIDRHKEFPLSKLLKVELSCERALDIVIELVNCMDLKARNRLIERYGHMCAVWAASNVTPHLRDLTKDYLKGGPATISPGALVRALTEANNDIKPKPGAFSFDTPPLELAYNTVVMDYINILVSQPDEQEVYFQLTVDTMDAISKKKNKQFLTNVLNANHN